MISNEANPYLRTGFPTFGPRCDRALVSTPLIPSLRTEDGDIVEECGRKEDREVATKVANDPQLSLTFLTNHLRSLFGPKTQQDYSRPSIPWISAFDRQHHYMIGIFGTASDLRRTSVISYWCYQSSDFDIGDYLSLFYFYPLTPTHVIPYCSFLSPLSLRSHAHPMTFMTS